MNAGRIESNSVYQNRVYTSALLGKCLNRAIDNI